MFGGQRESLDPHRSTGAALLSATESLPKPGVLAHGRPSGGSPVLQEPRGLVCAADRWWRPAGPPTQQGRARICAHTHARALKGGSENSNHLCSVPLRWWFCWKPYPRQARRVRKGGACVPIGNQWGPFHDVPSHQIFPAMRMTQPSVSLHEAGPVETWTALGNFQCYLGWGRRWLGPQARRSQLMPAWGPQLG